VQSPPFPRYLVPPRSKYSPQFLRPKYSLQHAFLRLLQNVFITSELPSINKGRQIRQENKKKMERRKKKNPDASFEWFYFKQLYKFISQHKANF